MRALKEAEEQREAALQHSQASEAAAREAAVETARLQASLRERDTTVARLTRARDDAAASLEHAQVPSM